MMKATTPRLEWCYEYPYWESSLFAPKTGTVIPPFHFAVKKMSEYGVDDGFVAKLNHLADLPEKWSKSWWVLYKRHRWQVEGIHGEAKVQHAPNRAVRRERWNVGIQSFLTELLPSLQETLWADCGGLSNQIHSARVIGHQPPLGQATQCVAAVSSAMDFHANVSPATADFATELIPYRENPHTDVVCDSGDARFGFGLSHRPQSVGLSSLAAQEGGSGRANVRRSCYIRLG